MGQFSLFDTEDFLEGEVFLFFDTETNGLPYDYKAPETDVDNWPRLIQLAWIQTDNNEKELSRGNFLIKPDGFYVFDNIHGITNDKAVAEGVALNPVLEEFASVLEKTTVLVAHNISFDEKIMGAEFVRNGFDNAIKGRNQICTMKSTIDFCAIPSGNRFKFPKLAELYMKLFNETFEGAHDAMVDVEALTRCFWALKNQGVISLY